MSDERAIAESLEGARYKPDSFERGLVTTILQAAEAVSSSQCPPIPGSPEVVPAQSNDREASRVPEEFRTFADIVAQVQALLGQDTLLASQLSHLPDALHSRDALRLLFHRLFPPPEPDRKADAERNGLTPTEKQILHLATCGMGPVDIANELEISLRTVEGHLRRVYRKLGEHRPLPAIVRAVERGYLEIEAVAFLQHAPPGHGRNLTHFESLCNRGGDIDGALASVGLRPVAEFGLFLLCVCSLAARNVSSYRSAAQRRGIVCEIDGTGRVINAFGTEQIGPARCIVLAPPEAAEAGFTPGHLYVAHDLVPQHNLNRGAIAEFTPQGRLVRVFSGGAEVGTRLIGPLTLAFDSRGRLLATSGMLTDAILRFEEGGRKVTRLLEGVFNQVCVGKDGRLYAPRIDVDSNRIGVYAEDGTHLEDIGEPKLLGGCQSVAVREDGRLVASYDQAKKRPRVLLEYDPNGQVLRNISVAGENRALISIDA